ncbi:type IV pilus modification protein PilV [Paludibacterium denitrificans]|uniref:Type IV pilus modification protein PilV n=1 Tax=Paludibacterium denitrificans TaxID=2675226 RepID=A0A844GBZ1_9NEIS|nr:type IV pilus modification protein PilV [Paludibacterium denitrificans]MTD33159.1 type IV pilus modification protein PilV [Paludibacterium denitrificans]
MKRGSGFTLLEVLVSILVVGIGLLALAATQGRSLKAAREAEMQGVAAIFSEQIADAMRANSSATINASGNVAEDWSGYVESSYNDHSSVPTTKCTATASDTACTSSDMAAYDLYKFKSGLASAFNGTTVRAIVCRDSSASSSISFDDDKLGGCTGGSKLMIRVAGKRRWKNRQTVLWAPMLSNNASATATNSRVYGYVVQFEP